MLSVLIKLFLVAALVLCSYYIGFLVGSSKDFDNE
jgi:hypothetical protein